MSEQMFPVWDKTGTHILVDETTGADIMLSESQVRLNISRRRLTVRRERTARKILQTDETDFFGQVPLVKKIDSAQPYCVQVHVGDHYKAFMHVAQRCSAHYDGRNLCIGSDGLGHKVFTKQKIAASRL